jgi:excisionase family DNA binding protein
VSPRQRASASSVPFPMASAGRELRLLTIKEAASILATSTTTIRRLVCAGKLPAVRLTRRIHLDIRDLDRLVEQAKDRTAW